MIYFVLCDHGDDAISAINKLLIYNINPPSKYILYALMQNFVGVVKTFDDFNIDVKSLLSGFVSTTKKTKAKIELFNSMEFTLYEYIKINEWYYNYYESDDWTS